MAFREDFVWGAASSAYQTEGCPTADGGGQSVWDVFCRRPGAIANGEDGSIACDGYHRFEEDILASHLPSAIANGEDWLEYYAWWTAVWKRRCAMDDAPLLRVSVGLRAYR